MKPAPLSDQGTPQFSIVKRSTTKMELKIEKAVRAQMHYLTKLGALSLSLANLILIGFAFLVDLPSEGRKFSQRILLVTTITSGILCIASLFYKLYPTYLESKD